MAVRKGQDRFRVVIVGGSIAGLTLAHSLHHAGIDYVVLEARDRIDPQVGASIGIFSNGARILDQLGVYDEIERYTERPVWHEMITGEGKLIQKVDSLQLIEARTGYPVSFLERQRVLKILYDRFPDKTKIHTIKKVTSVDQLPDGVRVHCEDGSRFAGEIVAGADGVHSKIRREMWLQAERNNGLKNLAADKKTLSAEYRCLFGMSSPVPGLDSQCQYRAFNKDWSFLVVVGKGRQVFWFAFEKLDKIYRPPNMPRYTEADQTEFVKPFMKRYVSQTVTFDAVWKRKTASSLTVLEEAMYQHWTYGRFVCLGDSVHKMTPNIGQGGNWAIESAATLANNLHALAAKTKRPSIERLQATLRDYEQTRRARTKEVCETAGYATRLEAFATITHKIFSLYVVPNTGDLLVDVHCQAVAQAPRLDFFPIPEKSLRGLMPFGSAHNDNQRDHLAWRVLRALPLLGFFYAALLVLGVPEANAKFEGFLPSLERFSPAEKLELIGFLGDLAPFLTIVTTESIRRGNNFTVASLWPLFGLFGQWKGLGLTVPIYLFFHYIQSSLERYAAPDNRLVPTNYAKTLVAAIAIGYIVPTILLFSGVAVAPVSTAWQFFPLTLMVSHRALSVSVSDTTAQDRITNPWTDIKYLRRAHAIGGILSGLTYLGLWSTTPEYMIHKHNLSNMLTWRGWSEPTKSGLGELVKYNHLITLGSGLFWQLLHFRDLKSAKKLDASWLKIIGFLGGTAAMLGPGAAMAVGWAWRESVLARG
ncbi:FAD-dependent oxidoreductase [Aspergillus affinis]|uniref:FAD-dependent oxidoreductase n=1 Tax=Aspergillus affinis TaxID=1070780 RepID=UPI0022FE28FE|nr:uncharacterized protein KD926_000104 [Aspergillus affinis]KAI9037688.1 hypothetical protein KD926_000104 [Aspergillus affinis]